MSRKYKKFNLTQQIYFSQRLSLLLQSGISIVEALSMMMNVEAMIQRKRMYEFLIASIQQGMSLSKAIKSAKISFNNLLVTLIQNGESSGHLAEALHQAYVYLEKKGEMKKKLVSSLLYPCFIIIATIAMTLFLILYIFPKIVPLLSSLDIELPLITQIVQAVYHFCISYGLWTVTGVLTCGFLFKLLVSKSTRLKRIWHTFIISIPFVRDYIKVYLMSSFCNIGEMLLSSGKGVPELLLFSESSVKNIVYKKVFLNMHEMTIQGVSFSTSLKKYEKHFPKLLIDMSMLGERTGNLALMLGHCSRIFEQDIENALKRFSSLIEPCLMVFMGLIVGSVALSIILPVYEITNHLSR